MKLLLLLLLTLIAGCYERKEPAKIIRVTTSPDLEKGESLQNTKKDSAFYYFNKVVTQSKDSLPIAVAYNYMSVLQHEAGDYFSSEESLLQSLKHLNRDSLYDRYTLTSDYTILGNNFLALKNYDAAFKCYDTATKYAPDETIKLYTLNNQAVAYQKTGNYGEAIKIYSSILGKSLGNKIEYARILSNLARAKWLRDPGYNALPEFSEAMNIRLDSNDYWGLNASYAHLADYHSGKHPDSALLYARKMYIVAKQLNSPDDQLEALQKLVNLGPPKDLRKFAIRYQQLNDSVISVRNYAKNQFALIRYESEKSKAENLALQKDNAEKKEQIAGQWTLFYLVLFIVILAVVMAVNWYRKRKQQLQWESQKLIQEDRLRTSQKVHDIVANGLYQLMARLQHQPGFNPKDFIDEIEIMYEKSRDISYEQPVGDSPDSREEIAELLMSFASPETRVFVVVNNKETWSHFGARTKRELKLILRELMVNMKKHSKASNVAVTFKRQNDRAEIVYKDDGIGLPASFQYGNGLTSTENRIKSIGGSIIFENSSPKGLTIRITFPIV